MKDCEPNAVQCDGDKAQLCDESGHWVANGEEADGKCLAACVDGECKECVDGTTRCTVCEDDDADCDTNLPQKCVAGVWTDEKKSCAQFCDGGGCVTAPSCDGPGATVTKCTGEESCCRSFLVPGGEYDRFDEDSDVALPTDVGPFFLDKFEVTVGRFRQFVSAYSEVLTTTLKDGAGKSGHITDDSGWNSDFVMPVDKAALTTDLKSCAGATWSDDVPTNNTLPLNCVSFNVAYAFCVWDEGRLPTEAEWQFAAGGGLQRRVYPWIAPVSGPDITHEYANYAEAGDESSVPLAVGSKPLGNGRWGQGDLAGNLSEWTLDYFHPEYPTSCTNCLNTTASDLRSVRGGSYSNLYDALWVTAHTGLQPLEKRTYSGFRCARDSK
jgi:formylglycine-generating enzyme required for sulfatase activity